MAGLRFRDVAHRPLEVLDLTSLTVDEFTALVAPFEGAFQAHMAAWRFDGQPRGARRYTTYATCPLPTAEDRLLFLLVYLKTNPLQIVHGRLFGLPQGKTNQWIHVLLPVLQEALRQQGDTPSRSLDDLAHRLALPTEALAEAVTAADTADTGEALAETADTAEAGETAPPPFCHDGTERRIPRPTAPDAQKSCYSGKKKCHTVKNVLLVDATLTILFLSATQHDSRHDKRIADATPYPLPRGSHLLQDLGFQAFSLEGVTAHTPHKKPRGGLLTEEQKESNRHLARRRIRIEHVNSSVKRCRIAKDTIRLMRAGVRDSVIEICSALHNFRVRLTPWLPMT